MKNHHILPFILFTFLATWKPTPIGKAQSDTKDSLRNNSRTKVAKDILEIQAKSDSLNEVKNDLFDEAMKNQDLITRQKPAKIIKTKKAPVPVPIPIPVPVTVYVKPNDTVAVEPQDTALANDYLRVDSVTKVPGKKHGFFYRIFHWKK